MNDPAHIEDLLYCAFAVVGQLESVNLPAKARDEVRRLYEVASAVDAERMD